MTIEDDIAFFERVPTLALLGRGALRILAIGVESRYIHGGEILFRAGDEADSGFIVQEGSFVLSTQDAEGGGKRMKVGPGTLLGELALFTDTRRPATATALEPSTVLRIPRPLFIKMLDGFPDAAQKLRDVIARRLNDSSRDIQSVRAAFDVRPQQG